ncbi:MAG: CNNM domain-containing protein, partial [Woeseiaceae bacterium]
MSSLTYSLIAVFVLLAANAFFVAAEFALVKIRGYQLDQAVNQQRRAALLSARMHNNLDAYLAACQLGITMASLGLGWVGEPAVAALLEPLLSKVGITGPALHTISFIVGFLIFSSLHIVVGEQVPKTYAIRKPTPVTLALAYPLHWFYRLVFPLNWLLDRANAGILRLLGIRGGPH